VNATASQRRSDSVNEKPGWRMRRASQIIEAWEPWAISLPRRIPRSRRITITCLGAGRSVSSIVAPAR
jgi:hypothetical protein